MWPWGHLALGYLLYSPATRLRTGRPPGAAAVVLLAIGTQLPDVVDKSLAWIFHVVPQGFAVGHSVFVAVPLGIAAALVAARRGYTAAGTAFAVGWWSHLAGDVLVALATDNPLAFARVLWPVVTLPPLGRQVTALGRLRYFVENWLELLRAADSPLILVLYFGPLGLAVLLWLVDGLPGLPGLPVGRHRGRS